MNNLSQSEYVKIYHSEAKLLAAGYGVITVFGSFANALVVATYIKWRRTMLQEPRDIFIFSLAVGDFMMTTCVCPFGFAAFIALKWTTGHSGCVWYGFVSTWIGLSSMLQIAAVAAERYYTLSHSYLIKHVSRKRALQFTLSSWSLSCIVSCFPLLGWSKYTFEGFGFHCSILWSAKDFNYGSFSLFLLIFFFAIPVTLIFFSYIKIFFIVRRISLNARVMWGVDSLVTRESYVAQVKIAKQVLIVTGGFLFAWTPYAVMSTLVTFTGFKLATVYHVIPALFAKTSNIYNPIIYFFTYKRLYRKTLRFLRVIRSSLLSSSDSQDKPDRHASLTPANIESKV